MVRSLLNRKWVQERFKDITIVMNNSELMKQAKEAITKFSYIRLTFFDIHGAPRGIVAPVRSAAKVMESGYGFMSAALASGPNGVSIYPKEVVDINYGNALIIPDLTTLHPVSWLPSSQHSTGQFICQTYWDKTTPQEACPRTILKKQLKRLNDMGLRLYSGMELEFTIMDEKKEVLFSPSPILSMLEYTEFNDFLTEIDQNAIKAGIEIDVLLVESLPGRLEICTTPKFGIEGIDAPIILKQSIKELAVQKGLKANFMAQHSVEYLGHMLHMSLSVWKKDENINMFFDKDADDKLSLFAKHWIAGILHHAPALTALCCPTTNCYHIAEFEFCPQFANWGIQDRDAMIRAKNDGPNGTYLENRLSTGLANPYLVMAGMVAAGIDGVAKEITCPEAHDTKTATSLPNSLKEALDCLQKDDVMVEALGKTFVEWFTLTKTQMEIKVVEGITDKAELLKIERGLYAKFL